LGIFIERRKIKVAEAQEIANGQTYTGRQALEFGLVDKIGGENEIREFLKINNFNLNKIKIVDYNLYKKTKAKFTDRFFDSLVENMGARGFKIKTVHE
jgi:protease-4